ncbi:MAG: nucleotidyltransferase family protein [Armatimonadetes bacterium]|nr:nucleotidyltransferase family protein [Armatimonadota bacterium]
MTIDRLRQTLEEHGPELAALGVARLQVFGSVARGEARPDSDVDLLVELSRRVGLFELVGIEQHLEDLLACEVDMGLFDTLREWMKPDVERDRVDVWRAVA